MSSDDPMDVPGARERFYDGLVSAVAGTLERDGEPAARRQCERFERNAGLDAVKLLKAARARRNAQRREKK